MDKLKKYIPIKPILKWPHLNRGFFLKTHWSWMTIVEVLIQPEITQKQENYTQKKIEGGMCQCDKTIIGMRLISIFLYAEDEIPPPPKYYY